MANLITGTRIVCAFVLCFCPMFSKEFYVVYMLGGFTDVLDGIVARHFGKETKLGAQLDTLADTIFTMIVIIKVVQAVYIPSGIVLWIVCIAFMKCFNIVYGFVIYKRFVYEHTILNKMCGVLLFLIPISIGVFSSQLVENLIIIVCIMATLASMQESYCIYIGKEIH
ncbi:MAG: CDP-alcohol phosphatidyltransferase family protein [Firmicutes bacterium]|nr:CDP-alcohol phosphatidyltransferase family protein [Bacillota bacterium]